jgi:glycosyltransferase involved in cell wall biosynthesis
MSSLKKKIFFIHKQRAHLPELFGYKDYFGSLGYDVLDLNHRQLDFHVREELRKSVAWYFMGFYPRGSEAAFTVHDYRSLSVGVYARAKDKLKATLNHKPDLRIFLNPKVREFYNFTDGVPSALLDMGLPSHIAEHARSSGQPEYDFIYIGAISYERGLCIFIRNFLRTYGSTKSLLLVGKHEKKLRNAFKEHRNIIFRGCVSQDEAFDLVKRSAYAVCVIPDKYPYCYQTPTKLLEYLALGAKVITTRTATVLEILEAENCTDRVYLMDGYQPPSPQELSYIRPAVITYDKYRWDSLIAKSGIPQILKNVH